jgi:hypothetical protein
MHARLQGSGFQQTANSDVQFCYRSAICVRLFELLILGGAVIERPSPAYL